MNRPTHKEQRDYILRMLDKYIDAARKRWREVTKAPTDITNEYIDEHVLKHTLSNIEAPDDEKIVIIHVPYGVQYKLPNTLLQLLEFRKRVKSTLVNITTDKKKALPKPIDKPLSQIENEALNEYLNAYDFYREQRNLEMSNRLKLSLEKDYPKEFKKLVKQENDECKFLIVAYHKETSQVYKHASNIKKWGNILRSLDCKDITLKSLTTEFRGRTPSYKDVIERLDNTKQELKRSYDYIDRVKEDLRKLHSETYNKLFEIKPIRRRKK